MFSHPMICPFGEPFTPARNRAYRGVTFITFVASNETYQNNELRLNAKLLHQNNNIAHVLYKKNV